MADGGNEPSPRCAPASAPVEGQLLVWGGDSRSLEEGDVSLEDFVSAVYKFDSYLETSLALPTLSLFLELGKGSGTEP